VSQPGGRIGRWHEDTRSEYLPRTPATAAPCRSKTSRARTAAEPMSLPTGLVPMVTSPPTPRPDQPLPATAGPAVISV